MLKAHEDHRDHSPKKVGFYVVTVSTSRYFKSKEGGRFTDDSGDAADEIVRKHGHRVEGRALISDDASMLKRELEKGLSMEGVDAVLFTGGTGVSPTDITVETLRPRFQKEIEGFGELLRFISYQKIGAPAMLSRATAGIVDGRLVLCLPGSPDGVRTALGAFISDIPHVIFIARGQQHH